MFFKIYLGFFSFLFFLIWPLLTLTTPLVNSTNGYFVDLIAYSRSTNLRCFTTEMFYFMFTVFKKKVVLCFLSLRASSVTLKITNIEITKKQRNVFLYRNRVVDPNK
jgi:hypothetical protein